jgi:replicative DNA helicase
MKQPQNKYALPMPRIVEGEEPHNEDAEKMVLSTLINYPNQIEQVIDVLQPQDFYVNRHRMLYETMLNYYRKHGKGADLLVLTDLVEKQGELDGDEIIALMKIRNEVWSSDLPDDVKLITAPSAGRQFMDVARKLFMLGYNVTDPDKGREAAERLLYTLSIKNASASDFDSVEDILTDYMNDVEYASQHRGQLLGVTTGFDDLDVIFNGLQKGDFDVLGGRPSMGKTALGMNIGYNAAKAGHAVAVFSLEMGKKQLVNRLLSLVSRVPSHRIRTGWLDDDEMQRVVQARDVLSDLHIYIDDTSGSPVSSIRSKLRRLQAKIHRRVDLVIVDYLQLMEDDEENNSRKENRNQEISEISRGMKKIARDFNIPVLALAQLSRAVESRASKIPQMSDLRESGSLEQDADIVAFVYRDEYYNPESERRGVADVVIAKHRNGSVGTVSLAFNGALTRFDNLEEVSPVD